MTQIDSIESESFFGYYVLTQLSCPFLLISKRCGHVAGKSVVPFDEAVQRVKAACDAR